jgi:S23 ribosomal protein.
MNADQNKNQTFFRFEDLRVYHKSNECATWISNLGITCINEVDIHFFNRFCDEAFEIPSNIAEGSSRNKVQFVHYLKLAKSSIRKCVIYSTLAKKRNLISTEQELETRNQLMELTKMLGALITSLQKAHDSIQDEQPENDSNW